MKSRITLKEVLKDWQKLQAVTVAGRERKWKWEHSRS